MPMDKNITDKKRNGVIFCALLIILKKPNIILLFGKTVSYTLNIDLYFYMK